MKILETRVSRKKFCSWCTTKGLESKMLGFRFIQCDCTHSKVSIRCYYISWKLVVANALIVILSVYVATHLFTKLYREGNLLDFDNRRVLGYSIGLVGGIAAILVSPWDFRIHVSILEIYNELVHDYNFSADISHENELERRIGEIYNLIRKLFLGKSLALIAYSFWDVLVWEADLFEKICILLNCYFSMAIVLSAVGAVAITNNVLVSAGNDLRRVFHQKINEIVEEESETGEFASKLSLFVKFQKRCEFSTILYVRFLSHYLPFSLMAIFSYCIIQFSVVVEMVTNAELNSSQLKDGFFMLVAGSTVMFFMLFLMAYIDSSRDSVRGIISAINKFPTGNFKPEEILMVETLLTNLQARLFTVNIADMFTVSSEMIASFAGIVVTYVLVIMQFQTMSWRKP